MGAVGFYTRDPVEGSKTRASFTGNSITMGLGN